MATDGRRARSERTRTTVAEAMLDCLEEGRLRPSAKEVAERAGVSTRAVFRHFDNMESLFEEVARLQTERVLAQLPPLQTRGALEDRIVALVAHSARRNELITPVRRATLLSEPFSPTVRERLAWMRSEVRSQIRAVFSDELAGLDEAERRERVAVLRSLLSFSYWDELRRSERLSYAAASRVLIGLVRTWVARS